MATTRTPAPLTRKTVDALIARSGISPAIVRELEAGDRFLNGGRTFRVTANVRLALGQSRIDCVEESSAHRFSIWRRSSDRVLQLVTKS